MRHFLFFSSMVLAAASVTAHGTVIDFSDQALLPETYNNGGPTTNSNGFHSGGAFLNNSYDADYDSWIGWSLSNVNDNGTVNPDPDYGGTHPYAAIPGQGVGGLNSVYAIGYADGYDPTYINLPAGQIPVSFDLTNDTTTYLSMENGDAFARKFGPSDYFYVTLTGYSGADETGNVTGATHFYLAQNGTLVNSWDAVDLSGLGNAASIDFSFTSSDNGTYGINTPTYVALDDLTTAPVPEPASLGLMSAATVMTLKRRRRGN